MFICDNCKEMFDDFTDEKLVDIFCPMYGCPGALLYMPDVLGSAVNILAQKGYDIAHSYSVESMISFHIKTRLFCGKGLEKVIYSFLPRGFSLNHDDRIVDLAVVLQAESIEELRRALLESALDVVEWAEALPNLVSNLDLEMEGEEGARF